MTHRTFVPRITSENLTRRATGYSSIDRAEKACAQAVAELEACDWLETVGAEFRLTKAGLAACDRDEREIDAGFVSCWPAFGQDELEELLEITTQLNNRFKELSQSEPESKEG